MPNVSGELAAARMPLLFYIMEEFIEKRNKEHFFGLGFISGALAVLFAELLLWLLSL